MPTIDFGCQPQTHKAYVESIIFETDNYCLVEGWLNTWSPGHTPEFLFKSKRTNKVIKLLGRQSMSAEDIATTIERGKQMCLEYERNI